MLSVFRNPRMQGNVGMGIAIAYFTTQGYIVSIPLTDSQDYDLVVDIDNKLCKIQVKTVYCINGNGKYQVNIRTCGGNRSGNTIKYFDNTLVDYIFVVTNNMEQYLIPSDVVIGKSSIALGDKFKQYKLNL